MLSSVKHLTWSGMHLSSSKTRLHDRLAVTPGNPCRALALCWPLACMSMAISYSQTQAVKPHGGRAASTVLWYQLLARRNKALMPQASTMHFATHNSASP